MVSHGFKVVQDLVHPQYVVLPNKPLLATCNQLQGHLNLEYPVKGSDALSGVCPCCFTDCSSALYSSGVQISVFLKAVWDVHVCSFHSLFPPVCSLLAIFYVYFALLQGWDPQKNSSKPFSRE